MFILLVRITFDKRSEPKLFPGIKITPIKVLYLHLFDRHKPWPCALPLVLQSFVVVDYIPGHDD